MVRSKFNLAQGGTVRSLFLIAGVGLSLSACASVAPMPAGLAAPTSGMAVQRGAHAPSSQGYARQSAQPGLRPKLGAPYQAGGVWYVPADQPAYDEVGMASWYGDQFNGKPTADGEIFDMNGVSAAHATLPLPSIVEVTNLETGKTIQVRLNDRGPFHPGRIIDLSRGAAQQLGFFEKGTAQVRVRFVRAASTDGLDAPLPAMAANPMHWVMPPAPVAPTPRTSGGFAVQAAAFSDRGNAERAAARLANAGRTVVSPVDRSGARFYRVTVGSWSRAEDAGAARNKVVSLGFADARVVAGS